LNPSRSSGFISHPKVHLALGTTQPRVQWVLVFSTGVKKAEGWSWPLTFI